MFLRENREVVQFYQSGYIVLVIMSLRYVKYYMLLSSKFYNNVSCNIPVLR